LWLNGKTTTNGDGGVIVTGKVVLNWSQHDGNVFTDMQVTVHIVGRFDPFIGHEGP